MAVALCSVVACGGGSDSGPAGATATTTAVSVSLPAGSTVFIGTSVQLEARETLSDGTTRTATNVTWGSDAPSVATVSQTGLVTGVAAGEATIFADVNPRGTLLIRVFPSFEGSWTGNETIAGCQESGAFQGLCASIGGSARAYDHHSTYTQSEASVEAELDTGEGTSATTTGTITVDGELQLLPAPVLPAEPGVDAEIRNWRSRADTPSRMTGSYDVSFTSPVAPGSALVTIELQDVVKSAASLRPSATSGESAVAYAARRIAAHLSASR